MVGACIHMRVIYHPSNSILMADTSNLFLVCCFDVKSWWISWTVYWDVVCDNV